MSGEHDAHQAYPCGWGRLVHAGLTLCDRGRVQDNIWSPHFLSHLLRCPQGMCRVITLPGLIRLMLTTLGSKYRSLLIGANIASRSLMATESQILCRKWDSDNGAATRVPSVSCYGTRSINLSPPSSSPGYSSSPFSTQNTSPRYTLLSKAA